ncbi:hypothetical protein [Variovorax ginsengisoli]|uniref:Uncharacterized protein n=1 Tax=Variovorax ginsengisoli TaxID=363844 RepID=A0ABT9S8I8_9BURK|nr:hypothetical protein [Variovorax ginsengisoli]MDP9900671.1 hypothetical protein [Variovorax ginsengisoli]
MKTPRRFEYDVFADYFQFYLQDESAESNLGACWTDEAVERLLVVAPPGTIGIGTVRNMSVPVAVEVAGAQPDPDFESWDYVAECALEVPSGRIVIAGCTDYFPDAPRIDVEPGSYRVRISYGALDSVSEDGLEGRDHYRLQLWPAPSTGLRILKPRVA